MKRSVKKVAAVSLVALSSLLIVFMVARAAENTRRINLPTSKSLTLPVPGYLARTNSFPATIALSPDGRYAALLNQGYGTRGIGSAPVDRNSRSQQQSTARFSRRPPERRLFHAPKLFHRPGILERRQASLRLDGLDHRSHRREAHQHRQRHRSLQIRGRTSYSRALHQDSAPAHRRRQRSSVRPAQNSRRNCNSIPGWIRRSSRREGRPPAHRQ